MDRMFSNTFEPNATAALRAVRGAIRVGVKRLEHELAIIRNKGFAPYFLVVRDIVRQSARTCGRGSAAASIVSYCLGITHVEPIRHNLFFERFLNEGRTDPPDIDVDFPGTSATTSWTTSSAKYGAERTAMIANHVGFPQSARP